MCCCFFVLESLDTFRYIHFGHFTFWKISLFFVSVLPGIFTKIRENERYSVCFSRDLFVVQCSMLLVYLISYANFVYIVDGVVYTCESNILASTHINQFSYCMKCVRKSNKNNCNHHIQMKWNEFVKYFQFFFFCRLLFAYIGRCIIYLLPNLHIVVSNFSLPVFTFSESDFCICMWFTRIKKHRRSIFCSCLNL